MPVFSRVPGKSELTKLQVKHAILPGADVDAIGKAVAALEAAASKKEAPVTDMVKPVQGLIDAIKQYEAKNGKKNPKFTAALIKDFGVPVKAIANDLVTMSKTQKRISVELDDAEKRWKVVLLALKKPLDDAAAKKLEQELTLAKGFMNQAMAGARDMDKDLGGSPKFKSIYTTLDGANSALQAAEKEVVLLIKAKNYKKDMGPIVAGLNKAHNATTQALKLANTA